VETRAFAIQSGVPFKLKIVNWYEGSKDDMLKLERYLHKKLKRYNCMGREWYKAVPRTRFFQTIKEIAEDIIKTHKIVVIRQYLDPPLPTPPRPKKPNGSIYKGVAEYFANNPEFRDRVMGPSHVNEM
jgi:hypothetical protein